MSVKKILLVGSILVLGGAFTYLGIADAVKTKDSLDFQQVELKSRSTEIQQLNIKYDKLNTDLDNASKQKEVNQQEVERLNKEKQDLEQQKKDLEAQLQAKLEQKSKIALASEKAINSATGTATASAMSGGSVTSIIAQAGAKYGVSYDYMYNMGMCESTLRPSAVNSEHVIVRGVDYGPAKGLYQFIDDTWARMSAQAGYAGASVFDPTANANVFAWAVTNGHKGEWQCVR